jgi:predicted ArsR family transcriptional regulator
MTARTRLALTLLADELTGHVLEHCAHESRSERDLVSSSRAARATVAQRIELLEMLGLLVRQTPHAGSMGRPTTRWLSARKGIVAEFERAADAFVLALLEAQVEDQEAAIRSRRAHDMQLSTPDTSSDASPPTRRQADADRQADDGSAADRP